MREVKNISGVLFLFIWAMLFWSCEKALLAPDPSSNAVESFEHLWTQCDEGYSFFEYKGIDWNEVRDRYAPRIYDGMPQDELFSELFAMLNELEDGHVNLISPFNVSRYEVTLLGPETYDGRLIKENYTGLDYYITGPFLHDFLAGGEIGYISYRSFSNAFATDQMDIILERYANTKGIILDIRGNGGGFVSNVFRIGSRFTAREVKIYDSYLKNGPGHNDFADAKAVYLEPHSGVQYTGQVILLTDRGTYSAGSFLSAALDAVPNVTLLGDTTGGGGGAPNGGQLPNGWYYRFSVSQTIMPDGTNFEGGVPPDIYLVNDPADMANGRDTMLEAAIDLLLK